MMTRLPLLTLLFVVWLIAGLNPAHAQDRDLRPLFDRLDRLERDMNLLQRQVYRGPNGAPLPAAPAPESGGALNADLRMDRIEEQLRSLTGQLEEANNGVAQLKRRLDKLVDDVDQRLTALERNSTAAAEPPKPGTTLAAAAPPPPPPKPPVGAGANPGEPASREGVLGTLHTTAPADGAGASSAQEQYDNAFKLLRQSDYPAAEQAKRAFVERNPNDALAGNAQYWLGETFYVRKDYNNAAIAFAEGYQKY